MSESAWQDGLGLIGLALGVAGLWEIPLPARLLFLIASGTCLLISFTNQRKWPVWMRLLLSILAVAVIALLSISAIKNP